MTIHEHFEVATADLSFEERHTMFSHLLGGLMQEIDSGRASKSGAVKAIDRARAFAISDRVRVGSPS